jgi:hypothetical protein
MDDGLSQSFRITEKLMQGCVASPLLFTLFISDIVSVITCSGVSGIEIGDLYILHMLLFADDMVLLAKSPRGLQLKINVLRKYFEQLGLTINVEETKVIVFRRGGRMLSGLQFKYGQEIIELVNEYVYLGVTFSSSCVFRKAAEAAKLKGMKALGWDVHEKLFESIVCSTVLYGAHIWSWNYPDIIEKVQSKFIRRLLHLDYKTPTYALRIEKNSYKLELTIARLTLNFIIRLLNMPDQRIAKMLFNTLRNTADGETLQLERYSVTIGACTLKNSYRKRGSPI